MYDRGNGLLFLYLSATGLGALQAAVTQAPVRRGSAAADDLELFLRPVCSLQKLLDELLQTHFSAGFPRCRLLQELIDLSHLSAETAQSGGEPRTRRHAV